MALSNAEVLANLRAQKTQLEKNIEDTRTTYLKVVGAIDVLEQIEEANSNEEVVEAEDETN
tara:strand:+ start:482 stop:664 length:183 start_codon:yes stop_codon:yes gene_type:complete